MVNNDHSRSNRHKKRRKNNRSLIIFLGLALLFLFFLLIQVIFNKDDKNDAEEITKEPKIEVKEDVEEVEEIEEVEDTNETVTLEEVGSEDENVTQAFIGDWKPIGTNQEGTHTVSYQEGSKDRVEVKKAVSVVTEIPEEDMIEWLIENGGDQKVIATVSDKIESKIYKVYLSWVDEQGWKVTRLEHLKQNSAKK